MEQNLQQLLIDTASAAEKLFRGLPIRVWYIKLSERAWKCIVINTNNKIKLAEGPIRTTPEGSLSVVKAQLESIVGKTKKTS
jgi:hypothetical protein